MSQNGTKGSLNILIVKKDKWKYGLKKCEGDKCYWKIRAKLLGDAVRDAFAFWFGADKLYEDAGKRFWDTIKEEEEDEKKP